MLKKKSFSHSMASMKELFPSYDYNKKKTEKNFIKENIQKVKGCSGCLLEKKILKMNSVQEKHKESKPNKQTPNIAPTTPSIKYNLKIIKKNSLPKTGLDKNVLNEKAINSINQSCQTDINQDFDSISINCQSCGQIIDRRNVALQTSVSEDRTTDGKVNRLLNPKELSHKKKECPAKKSLDLSNYKMGVVPKYLKEKNARHELEQKEKAEQKRLAELRGLNDPKCPPGHMLMPPNELRNQIEKMEGEFNALIKQLNMMPVSSDSYRVKQRKIQIEKALKELEDKLELFRSGKVFVPMSDQ